MQILEQVITVSTDDLDELNHVNNVRYVQWVNDIAKAHWEHNATQELLDTYFWILVNHNISYKAAAVLDDIVQLKTYVESSQGVTSIRIVEMYNANSQALIVKSETKWCLMSRQTLKPTRINTVIADLFC